jgi:hypothetical protein
MELVGTAADLLVLFALMSFVALMAIRLAVIIRRGHRVELGVAQGDPRRGILYSLTFSMIPWRKDSTRRHPWIYAAGMVLFLGVFLILPIALGRQVGSLPPTMVVCFGAAAVIAFAGALEIRSKDSSRRYELGVG